AANRTTARAAAPIARYGASGRAIESIHQNWPPAAEEAPRAGELVLGDGGWSAGPRGWPPASGYVQRETAWSVGRNVATTRVGVSSPLTARAVTSGSGGASDAK